MIGVLTSYAQMPFRVQQVPWAEYLVNLEKTSFLWLTCWGPAFIGNILLLIQLYDTFYSSSFASLASSAGAARCFSTKAARSSRSLLPLYSSAWEFRCIWPAHYIYHHFYLFAILVNVESGEAVDTMSTAELPVGIPVGGAVHVPDRHFSSLREGMSQDRVTRSNDSIFVSTIKTSSNLCISRQGSPRQVPASYNGHTLMHYSQNIATRTFVHQNFTPLLSLFKAALISLSPWSKELDKGNPSLDLGVEVVLV